MWASLTKRVVNDKPLAASRPGQQVVPATRAKGGSSCHLISQPPRRTIPRPKHRLSARSSADEEGWECRRSAGRGGVGSGAGRGLWGPKIFRSCFHAHGNSGFSDCRFACRLEIGLVLATLHRRTANRCPVGKRSPAGTKIPSPAGNAVSDFKRTLQVLGNFAFVGWWL
jgi:hypothetical protein